MNLRPWAGPIALGVLLAGAGGGAVLIARHNGSGGTHPGSEGPPPKLALASWGPQPAMGAPTSGSSQWQLEGTLSSEQPPDGRVRRPHPGSAQDAAKLATDLGLSGTPTEITGGWALRGPSSTVLLLKQEGSWTWAMDCASDKPIAEEDVNVGCGIAIDYAPPGPPPGPSEADTLRTARPVFDALGFDSALATATQGAESKSTASVSTASGWTTSLDVDRSLAVVGGNGWLAGSDEGAAYPLISAAAAFEALKAHPRPTMDMCMVRKDGQPGCADPAPSVVTGATLGLSLDRDGSGALLVPTWLFTVKDQPEPATWIAVDPAYLEPLPGPSEGSGDGSTSGGGGSSSSGGGSSTTPNSVAPAPATSPGSEPGSAPDAPPPTPKPAYSSP